MSQTSFKDRTGSAWDIRISILLGRTIFSRIGLRPAELLTEEGLKALSADEDKQIDLIWTCVERQAIERKLSMEQFFDPDRLDADTFERAIDCIYDAVLVSLPEKSKPAAEKVLRILRSAGTTTKAKALEAIEKVDEAKLTEKINDELSKTFTAGNLSSLVRSDSTPAT